MVGRAHGESARRVSDCVTALLRDQPFFGSLALRLPIRPDATRETLASDGQEIRYSPAWVVDAHADLIKTAIGRVVLACALKHHTRRGERAPERWQHASQLVTHGLLQDAGFKLPPEAQAWDGISVEQAYDRLPEPRDDGADGSDDAPPGNRGDGGGPSSPQSSAGSSDDDESESSPDPSDGGDQQDEDDSGEDQGDADSPSVDPAGTGEVMDAPTCGDSNADTGEAPSDVNDEEQAWDEAMHQALNLAKAQGKAPGSIEETIRSAHDSILDWRTLLRRYMTDAARSDYSWSFPNRRFIDSGLYLPSIRSERIDTVAVIIDTSASLPARTLAAFWTEVCEIATELQPETVIVLQVDTSLQDAAEYAPSDLPEEIALKGRGGTDFRPGFAWIEEQGMRPGVCIYLTDMECDRFPEAEPDFPVVWAEYGSVGGLRRQPPPWGEHITVED